MEEKHNRVIFHGQVSQKTSPFSIYRKKMSIFPASQFFPRPLTVAVITYSPLTLSQWVIEAKRKKNVSVQPQLISANRNTHQSHISHPQIPCTNPLLFLLCACLAVWIQSLTASIPSGEDSSVTMPCPYPNPTWSLLRALPWWTAFHSPWDQGRSCRKPQPHLLFHSAFQLSPPLPLGWDAVGCLATHC